jgi:hypothetical protein
VPAVVAPSPAEQVLKAWATESELSIEPGASEAVVIPQLVIDALGLDPVQFDAVAQIWEQAFQRAVRQTCNLTRCLR